MGRTTDGHVYIVDENDPTKATFFGPDGKGAGIKLPIPEDGEVSYVDSALRGGAMKTGGQNPYFPNYQPTGDLSLGGGAGGTPGDNPPIPPQGGGDPFDGGGGGAPPVNWAPGGGVGGIPGFEVIEGEGYAPQGFEGSANQDLYAQQLANLRTQEFRNQLRGEIARDNAWEAQKARDARAAEFDPNDPFALTGGNDPFAWAGGSTQFSPFVPDSEGSGYLVNPNVNADMSNLEIFDALSGGLSNASREYLSNASSKQGDWGDRTAWGRALNANVVDPTRLIAQLGKDGELGKKGRDAYTELFNLMMPNAQYTTPEGGGATARAGYALPYSPQMVANMQAGES